MMASPMVTSAAATTITNSTEIWPSSTPSWRPAATKVRFTALSISSIDMNITRALRRTRMPATPMTNSTAASVMYQDGVTFMPALVGRPRHAGGGLKWARAIVPTAATVNSSTVAWNGIIHVPKSCSEMASIVPLVSPTPTAGTGPLNQVARRRRATG